MINLFKDPVLITLNVLFLILIFHAVKIIKEKKASVSGSRGAGGGTIYGKKAIALGVFYLALALSGIFFEFRFLGFWNVIKNR